MNRKRLVKKILALGSGLTMLGATIMGATAGLEAYPSQFVRDGVFTGKIVVGKNAATSDVLGAIDIAASLQAASTVETPVEVPGAVGKTMFNGDALEWSLPNDLLGLGEPLGDVRQAITDQELNSLKGGVITTDHGSAQYNQYLRFRTSGNQSLDKLENGSSGGTQPSGSFVVFGKNDDPVQKVGDFLFFQEGNNVTQDGVFEYELEFQQGLQSVVKSRNSKLELRDLRDEVFNIFGQDFVFVDSTIKGNDTAGACFGASATGASCVWSAGQGGANGFTDVTIDFLGGDVTDVLQEGETKTYTIDGIDYEVTAVFIANPNTGTQSAKFSVNGELTQELQAGETDTLSDGLQIGIQEVLTNDRGGLVEFFLGANKITFRDTNTRDAVTNGAHINNGFHNGVTIANEIIEDSWVQITGSFIEADTDGIIEAGEVYQIQSIKYRLLGDALTGTSNIYIAPGHGLREFLDEPAGMLNPNWDIRYEGFYDVGSTPIKLAARADDEYWLEFTNRQGNYYNVPFVEITQSATFRYGRDETRDFVLREPVGFTANLTGVGGMNQSTITGANSGSGATVGDRSYFFPIGRKDTFILTNSIKNQGQDVGSATDPYDDTSFTHVLEYESIDTAISNQVITFEDLALGPKEVKYVLGCTDCLSAGVVNQANAFILGQFQLVIGGNTFKGYVHNLSTGTRTPYMLALDLNGDGVIDGDKARITVKGGGIVDLGNNTNATDASNSPGEVTPACPNQNCGTYVPVNVTTLSRDFDEPQGGPESVVINVTPRANINQVSVNRVAYYRQHIERTATTVPAFNMVRPDEVRDHLYAATDYGVLVDQYRPTSQTIPDEVTLDYPNSMRGVQTYVTAGKVSAQKTSGGGAFTTTQLNPIAVGLAVLDVDAPRLGSAPLIVVGGPCANSVAAQLLGNPANCGQGFEPGKAMIKWFPDKMALLVAGYEAQETLGASYVLADYSNYQLQGDEMEVIVADLNSVTVKPVA